MNKVVKGEKKVMEDTRTSLNTNLNATFNPILVTISDTPESPQPKNKKKIL